MDPTVAIIGTGVGVKFIVDALKKQFNLSGPIVLVLVLILSIGTVVYQKYASPEVQALVNTVFGLAASALGANFGLEQITGRKAVDVTGVQLEPSDHETIGG
jgi:hypothetical protein